MNASRRTCVSSGRTEENGVLKQEISLKRVIVSCMIGNALEWYDFILHGYFAGIIGKLFFPEGDELSLLLKSFGVFFAGFVMRPLGGILFGYIGDRKGRKKALMMSIYLMAIPTTLIGLLPTYAQVGVAATFCLVMLRLLQGLSMGGEFTASMIFIVENSPDKRRGFWGSFASLSALLGLMLGSILAYVIGHNTDQEQLETWGWRIPFLLSLVGSFLGAYMRRTLGDTRAYEEMKKRECPKKDRPKGFLFGELFRDHWQAVVTVILVDFTIAIGFFIVTAFTTSYLNAYLHFSYKDAAFVTSAGIVSFALTIPLSGWLCDRIGRRPIMAIAAGAFFLFSVPLFWLMSIGNLETVIVCQCCFGIFMGINFAPVPAMLAEQFPSRVRFSGVSIAHNLSMAFFGGTALSVVGWLTKQDELFGKEIALCMPGIYLAFAGLLSLVGIYRMKDKRGQNID